MLTDSIVVSWMSYRPARPNGGVPSHLSSAPLRLASPRDVQPPPGGGGGALAAGGGADVVTTPEVSARASWQSCQNQDRMTRATS
jgi:hypothetical protein